MAKTIDECCVGFTTRIVHHADILSIGIFADNVSYISEQPVAVITAGNLVGGYSQQVTIGRWNVAICVAEITTNNCPHNIQNGIIWTAPAVMHNCLQKIHEGLHDT